MPEKARQKLMERLYAGQQLHRQKLVHAEELFTADPVSYTHLDVYKRQKLVKPRLQ